MPAITSGQRITGLRRNFAAPGMFSPSKRFGANSRKSTVR